MAQTQPKTMGSYLRLLDVGHRCDVWVPASEGTWERLLDGKVHSRVLHHFVDPSRIVQTDVCTCTKSGIHRIIHSSDHAVMASTSTTYGASHLPPMGLSGSTSGSTASTSFYATDTAELWSATWPMLSDVAWIAADSVANPIQHEAYLAVRRTSGSDAARALTLDPYLGKSRNRADDAPVAWQSFYPNLAADNVEDFGRATNNDVLVHHFPDHRECQRGGPCPEVLNLDLRP